MAEPVLELVKEPIIVGKMRISHSSISSGTISRELLLICSQQILIDPENASKAPWSFIDAICAMHRRFVRTATANNAVSQYDRVEYSAAEGVEGFYYKLDKMANRTVERPSDYAFHLRLFEGLPTWIYDTLLEHNILPEFCNMEDICENAHQIEEICLRCHTSKLFLQLWSIFGGENVVRREEESEIVIGEGRP